MIGRARLRRATGGPNHAQSASIALPRGERSAWNVIEQVLGRTGMRCLITAGPHHLDWRSFRGNFLNMGYIMVDVEADGPIPGDFSMISFGAVVVRTPLLLTFHGQLRPISDRWVPEALAVSGFSREQTLGFPEPRSVMLLFQSWLQEHGSGRPLFISDNNGFDWQFINWYFHHFVGSNPFGFSSTNLGSLYKGVVRDTTKNFKHLRRTRHTHHPVDDAMGNAEALLAIQAEYELKMSL